MKRIFSTMLIMSILSTQAFASTALSSNEILSLQNEYASIGIKDSIAGRSCLEHYKSNLKRHYSGQDYVNTAVAGATIGLVTGFGKSFSDKRKAANNGQGFSSSDIHNSFFKGWAFAVVVPVVVMGVVEGVVAIQNIKPKKMIKLITQAKNYNANPGSVPGNLLERLYKSISKKRDINISDLAATLVKGNEDGTMCFGSPSYSKLKNNLKQGTYVIKTSQDNSQREAAGKLIIREVSIEETLKAKNGSVNKN